MRRERRALVTRSQSFMAQMNVAPDICCGIQHSVMAGLLTERARIMNISKTDDMRQEILHMTRELAKSEELNLNLSDLAQRRLVVPMDNEQLKEGAEKISQVLHTSPDRLAPLIVIGNVLGYKGRDMSDFIVNMLPYITVYKSEELRSNPYYSRINAVRMEEGRFRIENTEFLKGELFFDREPASEGYKRINRMGVFDGDMYYPGFYEGDRCWMSITPNEIVTMKPSIDEASGKVLTLGLGLGYYAYMTHLKDNVESVTIVEREPEVIDIFRNVILPQFDMPEKIHIVRADAFEFLENTDDGEYDYCFADIWQNPVDGMDDFLKARKLGNRFRKMTCRYWIEESFVGRLESSLANVIQYSFLEEDDSEMENVPGYALMKRLTQDVNAEDKSDIKHMFGGKYVRGLLDRI